MIKEQLWLVRVYKQKYLDDRTALVTSDRLTEVVASVTQIYDEWTENDFITIKPTEITYFG